MVDRNLIHATEDVASVLQLASDMGLVIQSDEPTDLPRANIVPRNALNSIKRGSFTLYKTEWIFGSLKYREISGGYNKGRFFQQPRTNLAPIEINFFGEYMDGDRLRLGGGGIAWHRTWSRTSDRTEQPTPPDIKKTYDELYKAIYYGKRLRGGGQTFMVLKEAWSKLARGIALPPYDYIEWDASKYRELPE